MIIRGLIDEDFINYKTPSMFISTAFCTFKCEKEAKVHCCQNSDLATSLLIDTPDTTIIERYLANLITHAIVFGGLEPFEQFDELYAFIKTFREVCSDEIIIYTGFYRHEIEHYISKLAKFPNIIVKFGRFKPDCEPHRDELLGVMLANPEQYAEKIS